MAIITLKNGIILNDQRAMAPNLNSWAKKKGLRNARVFHFKDGKKRGIC